MFVSLTSRIAAVMALVVIALLSVGYGLYDSSRQSRESFRWVTHSSEVIEAMNAAVAGVREAESGMRGYVLTEDVRYARSFETRLNDTVEAFSALVELTKDNPEQAELIRVFGGQLSERVELARQYLALAREGRFAEAQVAITQGHGLDAMLAMTQTAEQFLAEERRIQTERIAATERRVTATQRLALMALPLVAFLTLATSVLIIQGIRRPTRILNKAMTDLGSGELDTRIHDTMGSKEFELLVTGYNQMADRLAQSAADQRASERELHSVHQTLLSNASILRERGEVIELLGGMAHRMQAARTDSELSDVIMAFVPRVLPGLSGTLYAYNNSRNLLVPLAAWGDLGEAPAGFSPLQCWALRRGQGHYVDQPGTDVRCEHVHDAASAYHCEPLLASGEVIGVLYLEGVVDSEAGFRLKVLVENIASAMVNQQLQRDLREQTIRDPLTGLFNRRYMEEALGLEIARVVRSNQPLSVVMCDVDHFKRFNDEFGHDAGDVVLQAVGSELGNHFRDGDIVCRYGGEEFTIIAPATTPEALRARLEGVREAVSNLSLRHDGQALGALTMSFGVARWNSSHDSSRSGQAMLKAADAALYRAKREGRNRVVLDGDQIAA